MSYLCIRCVYGFGFGVLHLQECFHLHLLAILQSSLARQASHGSFGRQRPFTLVGPALVGGGVEVSLVQYFLLFLLIPWLQLLRHIDTDCSMVLLFIHPPPLHI